MGFFSKFGKQQSEQNAEFFASSAQPVSNQTTLQLEPQNTTYTQTYSQLTDQEYAARDIEHTLSRHSQIVTQNTSKYVQPNSAIQQVNSSITAGSEIVEYEMFIRKFLRDFLKIIEVQYFINIERKNELKQNQQGCYELQFDHRFPVFENKNLDLMIQDIIAQVRKIKPSLKSIKVSHVFANVYTVYLRGSLDLNLKAVRDKLPLPLDKSIKDYNLSHGPDFITSEGKPTKVKHTVALLTDFIGVKLREAQNRGKPGCITDLIGKRQIDFVIPHFESKEAQNSQIENLRELFLLENYAPVPDGHYLIIHQIRSVERGQRFTFTIYKSKA
jgi:hypothetical protein